MHTDYWREYALTMAATIAVGARWQRTMVRKAPPAERAAMREYCADVRRMAADYIAEQERRPC